MKLSDREWKDFAVPYVFQNIQRGKRLKKADHISGIVPYVSSTAISNGVDAYIEATKGIRVFQNCISLANSGSVGTAFYEPFAFVASDHVTSLKRENTSQYVYLFLTAVLEQQKSNFDFNREINDLRIKKMRIMLPVDDNDEPDYQFMEDYMKELMVAKRKRYQEHFEQRLAELGIDAKNTKVEGYNLDLKSRDWNAFNIVDIFALVRGVEGNMASLKNGYIPLISARNGNNGLKGFVDNPKKIIKGDCITLNNDGDGGAGLAYCQPCDMALDTHVTALMPTLEMSNNVMLFISECLSKLHGFFGHGHSISNKRALSIKIMLPVDNNGKPDYQFMEDYMKELMAKKYLQYLDFLNTNHLV